jgi:hypothetical protein
LVISESKNDQKADNSSFQPSEFMGIGNEQGVGMNDVAKLIVFFILLY